MRHFFAASLLVLAAPLAAQQAASPWQVRYDRPSAGSDDMTVAAMGTGWHVTTSMRGSGIAWRPGQTATGNYHVVLETSAAPSDHPEGYGLFVGGSNLDGDTQSYLYFLIRKDGRFLIKRRAGAETRDVVAWTPNAAIRQPQGSANATNTLSVDANADSVRFLVNGRQVHAMPRAAAGADGIAGLRVNHGLSVHVGQFAVTSR